MKLTCCGKLGQGSYGIVYHAKDDEKSYAIKCNLTDKTTVGFGSVREFGIVRRLAPHDHIAGIEHIVQADEFNITPPLGNYKVDKYMFCMELADSSLRSPRKVHNMDPVRIKSIIVQSLVGLAYIHSQGIIHQDIKPCNLLMENDCLIYCDFGMATEMNPENEYVQGSISAWYRPPEVELCSHYDDRADVFSLGMTLFEVLGCHPVLPTREGKYRAEFIKYYPIPVSKNDCKKFNLNACKRKYSLNDVFGELDEDFVTNFDKSAGSMDNLNDLLTKMIAFHPEDRPHMHEVMQHPFLCKYQDYIKDACVTPRAPGRISKIINDTIIELKPKMDQVRKNTNKRVLFTAFDLFDRYCHHLFLVGNDAIFDTQKIECIFAACLYLMDKYYTIIYRIDPLKKVYRVGQAGYKSFQEFEEEVISWEERILKFCDFSPWNGSFYHSVTKVPSIDDVIQLLYSEGADRLNGLTHEQARKLL